jgi:phosphoheptose isomerase
VAEHFRRSCDTLWRPADDLSLRTKIHEIAEVIAAAFRADHKLLIAGNGGSAAA